MRDTKLPWLVSARMSMSITKPAAAIMNRAVTTRNAMRVPSADRPLISSSAPAATRKQLTWWVGPNDAPAEVRLLEWVTAPMTVSAGERPCSATQ